MDCVPKAPPVLLLKDVLRNYFFFLLCKNKIESDRTLLSSSLHDEDLRTFADRNLWSDVILLNKKSLPLSPRRINFCDIIERAKLNVIYLQARTKSKIRREPQLFSPDFCFSFSCRPTGQAVQVKLYGRARNFS